MYRYKAQKTQKPNMAGPLEREILVGLILLKSKILDTMSSQSLQRLYEPMCQCIPCPWLAFPVISKYLTNKEFMNK